MPVDLENILKSDKNSVTFPCSNNYIINNYINCLHQAIS